MRRDDSRRFRHGIAIAAAGWLVGCGSEFESPPAPASVAPCNGPGAFSDSFDDGELSELFETQGAADPSQIEERDGSLVFAPDAGGYDLRRISSYAVDLRGSAVVVEVPQTIDGSPGTDSTYLELLSFDDSQIWMERSASLLEFTVNAEEGDSSSSTDYDAAAHRWWRIAEADGLVRFETSPDGQAWASQFETPTPSFVEAAYLMMGAWYDGQTSTPGQAHFDNLNPDGGSFCGLGQIQLGFDDPIGLGWGVSEYDACTAETVGGGLEFVVPAGGAGQCQLSSLYGYSLEGQTFTFAFSELPPAVNGSSVELVVRTGEADGADQLRMELSLGTLNASANIGATTGNGQAPLDAGPAWWRIAEQAGHLRLELSTDGSTFETVHELIVGTLPPAFEVVLRYHVNNPIEQDARLVVDHVN